MAWRFEPGEPLADAFRRVASEEVATVQSGLQAKNADGASTTHEARQSFKRLRALLRFAEATLGEDFDQENHRWREAGRRLAALRDGTVLQQTFDRVVAESGDGLPANEIAMLRADIVRDGTETDAAETRRMLRSVLRDLRGAERRLAALDWPETVDDIAQGLRGSQSRLRKSWKHARSDRSSEALHRWRKRVKDHSTQLRLLRLLAPHETRARREAQKRLAALLGEEHDLSLLAERLSRAAIAPAAEPVRGRLLEAVKKRRKALRRRAFRAAEKTCSDKPKAFAALLTAAWKQTSEA